jgi:hypothetical protein
MSCRGKWRLNRPCSISCANPNPQRGPLTWIIRVRRVPVPRATASAGPRNVLEHAIEDRQYSSEIGCLRRTNRLTLNDATQHSPSRPIYNRVMPLKGLTRNEMHRLGLCLTALRILAKSRGPHRSVLIESPIDEYLRSDPFSLAHALERLRRAIHNEEAQRREGEDWSSAREYVRTLLHRIDPWRK